jgi:hypothetical protein
MYIGSLIQFTYGNREHIYTYTLYILGINAGYVSGNDTLQVLINEVLMQVATSASSDQGSLSAKQIRASRLDI